MSYVGNEPLEVIQLPDDATFNDVIVTGTLEASGTGKVMATSGPSNSPFAFRNKIIGGDFGTNPWQRGTSFVPWVDSAYGADRWMNRNSTAAVVNLGKTLGDTPPFAQRGMHSSACLNISVTTADTSIDAADRFIVRQFIEGSDIASMGFGVAGSTPITLTFSHCHTKVGIYCVSFQNNAGDRNYIAEYVQDVSNTWETATITLTPDQTGTWLYDYQAGLIVSFALAAGTTFQGAANTWQAGNLHATANQVNALDSTANRFKLDLIQLAPGAVDTPFEQRPITTELALCQRYYYRIAPGAVSKLLMPSAAWFSATQGYGFLAFPTTMRIAPTALEQSGTANQYAIFSGASATTNQCTAVPTYSTFTTDKGAMVLCTATGGTAGAAGVVATDPINGVNAYLGWSAEL